MESKKIVQMNLFTKLNKVTDVENKLMLTRRLGRGGINWETGIGIYTRLHIKQRTSKHLLYSIVNSTQQPVISYMGKEC